MQKNNHQCPPSHLETAKNLVKEGAYLDSTAYRISITHRHQPGIPGDSLSEIIGNNESQNKTRTSPVIYQAQQELLMQGRGAIMVRGGSETPVNIIAWDTRIFYLIAVRRIRGSHDIRDISTRFAQLITNLRSLPIPSHTDRELWIQNGRSFQTYTVLAGGIVRREQP